MLNKLGCLGINQNISIKRGLIDPEDLDKAPIFGRRSRSLSRKDASEPSGPNSGQHSQPTHRRTLLPVQGCDAAAERAVEHPVVDSDVTHTLKSRPAYVPMGSAFSNPRPRVPSIRGLDDVE